MSEPNGYAVFVPECNIVGEIHHVTDRQLERLEVTDVDDPDFASLALICHVHLLPSLLQLGGVDPLVAPWVSDIVEVVVQTGSSTSLCLVATWEAADVAKVVVRPHQGDVFGNLHASIDIPLNLLVQAPHLRNYIRVGSGFGAPDVGQDLSLGFDDSFEKGDVVGGSDGSVMVATHAHGHHTLVRCGALGTFHEEGVDCLVVRLP